MQNNISQDFNTRSLLRFAFPTMVMMVFMSMYQMVDAVFISNFISSNALSALNIVYPIPSIIIALSVMLATGGSAIIAKNMGEGKDWEAKENFSFLIFTGIVMSITILVLCIVFLDPIIYVLGGHTEELYDYCHDYLLILILATPLSVLQMLFQTFFVTAGRPNLGLVMTVLGGVANIVLDYLFIVSLHMGVSGAAIATSIGYAIPALFGLFYFCVNREGTLYFIKPKFRLSVLKETCSNGASEMVNNMSVAITTYLFNILMLKYAGNDGVAAITIVLYAQFLMTSVFMGFSGGVAPVFSYKYGEENYSHIKRIFKISVRFVMVTSVVVLVLAYLFKDVVIGIFTPPSSPVFPMTRHGFILFSVSFLFTGLNIFSSALFTAFSNGKVSATLSFLRTFVFLVICLIVLPLIWKVDGIWIAVPIAEGLSFAAAIYCFFRYHKTYHFF